jgi:hypothetical protein
MNHESHWLKKILTTTELIAPYKKRENMNHGFQNISPSPSAKQSAYRFAKIAA